MSKQSDFFATYAPMAQAESARSGIPASIILAQAALESSWGLSGLTQKVKNFFGIKSSQDWNGGTYYASTSEYVGGQSVNVVAGFRSYDTAAESFADHTDFLKSNPRYAAAGVFASNDPAAVASALQKAGYATDPNYASSLMSVVKSNNLTQYDSGAPATGGAGVVTAGIAGDIGNGLNDARKWMTPDWWENMWSDIANGKNPLNAGNLWSFLFPDTAVIHQGVLAVIVLLILLIVGFLVYQSVGGIKV